MCRSGALPSPGERGSATHWLPDHHLAGLGEGATRCAFAPSSPVVYDGHTRHELKSHVHADPPATLQGPWQMHHRSIEEQLGLYHSSSGCLTPYRCAVSESGWPFLNTAVLCLLQQHRSRCMGHKHAQRHGQWHTTMAGVLNVQVAEQSCISTILWCTMYDTGP